MAHLIDQTNGAPGIAYVGATPWHKLGVQVPDGTDLDTMIDRAGLGWTVHTEAIERMGKADPGRRSLLVRADTGAILDVVGPRFQVTQNSEALDFLRAFCDAGRATLETVGALDEGRYVWGLARMGSEWNTGTTLRNGRQDTVRDFVLVALPHMQAKPIIARYTPTRVVCWNTLTAALRDGKEEFRLSHTRAFDERARAEAQQALGLAAAMAGEFQAKAQALALQRFTESDLDAFLCRLIEADTETARKIIDHDKDGTPRIVHKLRDAFQAAPGAQATAWGAFNAVTYYVDHKASKIAENRAKSGLVGTGGDLKERALELLTA